MAKRMGKTKPLSEKSLQDVPEQSGVYNLRNEKGEIIYTGSSGAGRLRARLREHLKSGDVAGARSFQVRPLSSAAEARRVGEALIARNRPRENRRGS
jgi:excinuclease UvrABC nuclease subunit